MMRRRSGCAIAFASRTVASRRGSGSPGLVLRSPVRFVAMPTRVVHRLTKSTDGVFSIGVRSSINDGTTGSGVLAAVDLVRAVEPGGRHLQGGAAACGDPVHPVADADRGSGA